MKNCIQFCNDDPDLCRRSHGGFAGSVLLRRWDITTLVFVLTLSNLRSISINFWQFQKKNRQKIIDIYIKLRERNRERVFPFQEVLVTKYVHHTWECCEEDAGEERFEAVEEKSCSWDQPM
jgi:hypothetical protein